MPGVAIDPTRGDGFSDHGVAFPAEYPLHSARPRARLRRQRGQRDVQTLSLLRRDGSVTSPLASTVPSQVARPSEQLVIRAVEQVIALHVHHQRRSAYPRKGKELLRTLEPHTVPGAACDREYQPVKAELSVIGCITKIAAIGQNGVPFSSFFVSAQVDPVPDKSSLQTRMATETPASIWQKPPKLLPIAWAYSLQKDQRSGFIGIDPFLMDHFGTAGNG